MNIFSLFQMSKSNFEQFILTLQLHLIYDGLFNYVFF